MILTQLQAYGITMAVEAVVAAAISPWFGAKRARAALIAAISTAATHPIVWRGYGVIQPYTGDFTLFTVEAFAVLAESCFYRAFATQSWRGALLLSFIANMMSFAAGELIYAL